MRFTLLVLALMVIMTTTSVASAASLEVGKPAPALAVSHWLKGSPVTGFEPSKVYVVEFWAPWCPPCISTIPHLTALQAKYKDEGVTIIGVMIADSLENGRSFVKKMGEKMNYNVATDKVDESHPNGVCSVTWMKAAGRNGIPCAFIVDQKGKIAWVGHPMVGLDEALTKIVEPRP